MAAAAGAVLLAGIALRFATYSAAPPPTSRTASSVQASKASRTAANLAPNGMFTTLAGKDMTVAALRGKPTLLWFLVAGCSSCAASAPAIAKYLPGLEADGVHVVSLDLYGDLPSTPAGRMDLSAFAANNAGPAWSSPGWTWGEASKALSVAYDPAGNPDVYVLIGPGGHLRYRNSIPVSTMPQLLAAAGVLTGHPTIPMPTPTGPTTTTAPTLP